MTESIGPYQIVSQLGAGGMGEVYKALDTRIGRQVALKLLPEALAQDWERRRRFEQEARVAASLNHPNIMAIYDVGLDQQPPYMVAELVPGESLRALGSKGPVAPRKAVDLAAQIAAGLAVAHAAGIVHRDLKPENVMVTPEGTAKILDFGIARMEARSGGGANATVTLAHTSAGSVVGTAAYMSPEQARGEEVDFRSDQFSLGLVLYEMLTGRQAFERPSAVQTMSAIVEDEPPAIERSLPVQLRWILERCLTKERQGRYESTKDLAQDLARLRDHYGELTATQSGVQAAVPVSRRVRRAGLGIAGGVAAGAVLAWCGAQLLADTERVDLKRYRLTPFATELANYAFPVWSPDGKSLAFYGAGQTGPAQLYVQSREAPEAVAITTPDATIYSSYPPVWSVDSHSLYVRCKKDAVTGLCRVPAGGGDTTMVHRNALCATMSPDGKTLAMLVFEAENSLRVRLETATPPDAAPKLYEPQPFEAGAYYNNPGISFSPDGKTILVAIGLEVRGETAVLAPWPAGKARPVFTRGFPFSFTPQASWMPDSRHIVFADSSATTHSQIYMADTGTGRFWPVLTEDRPASAPTVAPDGTRMAYLSWLSHADVIAAPLGDGPVRTILGSSRTEQMADASPTGPQLIYVTDRRGVPEVWMTSLAEGWDRPVFTPESLRVGGAPAELVFGPVFSPDGKRVAIAAKGSGRIHVYTQFLSGGTPVRATTGNVEFESAPTWSPDGKWLAFVRIANSSLLLSKVRPGTGEAPVDLAPVRPNPVPAWSPTGEWIAAYDGQGALKLVSPDGKESRTLAGDGGPFAWSRDGKTLYQIRRDPSWLGAIDISTGREQKLRDLAGLAPFATVNPGLHATLSYDGKEIIYTVNRPRVEVWMLEGIRTPSPWYSRLLGR